MSLSKIEMVGFKSFMNPSAIALRPGITAILGPNGCGKTNIVDAVRWVLGEQSARQLRGVKMENVIFNGTQTYKPLGAAVVSLTINNERGVFPLEYSEITVTRKLYRSGISEYFINKNPCRLKDIRELFADTGTGSHSYAVIEQEMIDWVLNDFHGERRLMFEEAAGIVKYRMRREEAERKLALTDADLLRLDDIMDELAKQVRSLRYQMGKAKRYQIVRERIRRWEVIEIRRRLGELLVGRRAAESELAGIADRSSVEDGSLGDLERGVHAARLLLVDLEKRSTELQNRRYEIRRTIQASEERVIQFTERRGEAERRIERARREIVEAEGRLERIAAKIAEAGRAVAEIEGRLGSEEGTLGALAAEFGTVAAAAEACAARIIDVKQTHLDFLQDRVRVESGLEHCEGLLRDIDAKSAETRGRISDLERENRELGADRERRSAGIADLQERVAAIDRRRGELFSAIEEGEKRLFDRERQLSELQADLARVRSRHDLMLRVLENYEGFPGGAQHVLRRGDGRVRGPLGELLKVEDEHRSALEAVLAGLLDGVVVDRVATALEFVDELSRQRLGRVRFFAEDTGGLERPERAEAPGSRGPLSSFVRGEGAARSLAERFLGDIHLFDDVDGALAFVTSEAGRGRSAVTRSGIYFASGAGIYFAGAPGEEVSLLGRRDEIGKMKGELERLEAAIASVAAECGEMRSSKDSLSAELQRLEAEMRSIRGELASKGEELQAVERDHIMHREQAALLMKTLNEMESSRGDILARLEEMRLTLRMREEEGAPVDSAVLETELAAMQTRKSALETGMTEAKVAIASLMGGRERSREELRGLAEMESQFRELVAQRQREIEESTAESASLDAATQEERAVVLARLEEERICQAELDEIGGTLDERRTAIDALEGELKARQAERARIFERQNEVKITLSTTDTKMRDVVEKAQEMYGADLSCYLEGLELPLTEEESAVTREMLDREKRKLESIGPVNLAAVEEFKEKKERLDFLVGQKADLAKAREELTEAIATINKRARSRFLETFEIVRGYFRETFEVLFEGGEADLGLGEGTDPLEADVIITARPKGKRLQDIALLSGGERALTALALLFALYKAKPSPFCIFDEVDAPLDDANIQRFVRMLKRFSAETQFIIITHNKRTMEAADTLYGVTMEERGVSRIVSVDLAGIEDLLRRKGPAADRSLVQTPVSQN